MIRFDNSAVSSISTSSSQDQPLIQLTTTPEAEMATHNTPGGVHVRRPAAGIEVVHRALALRRLVARGRPALAVLATEGLGVVAARRRRVCRELLVAALAELGGTCTVP